MTSKGFGIGWLCACLLIAQAHAASSSVEANGHRLTVRRTALTVNTILLDGRRMFDDRTDELVTLLGPFSGDGATFVLLDEQPGGNACAGMLQAIDLTRMPPVVTPSFGNCNDQVAPFVSGGLLHVTTPPFTPGGLDKGTSPAESYTFGSGLLTKLTTAPAPVRSPNAGLHAVSPTGPRRLYYAGLNTIGPTIRGALVARIVTWPPAFRVLPPPPFACCRTTISAASGWA